MNVLRDWKINFAKPFCCDISLDQRAYKFLIPWSWKIRIKKNVHQKRYFLSSISFFLLTGFQKYLAYFRYDAKKKTEVKMAEKTKQSKTAT